MKNWITFLLLVLSLHLFLNGSVWGLDKEPTTIQIKPQTQTQKITHPEFIVKFSSPEIEFLPKEHLISYQNPTQFIISRWLNIPWMPEWKQNHLPSDCNLEKIAKVMKSEKSIKSDNSENSENQLKSALQNFWTHCEPLIRNYSPGHLFEIIKMLNIDYDILATPLAHEVVFHLPNQIKVRGILFARSLQKRDLVILRPGIFSSFDSMIAERFVINQLFDEGKFNVLLIPSITGKQFIEDNESFIYGGFEEGIHTTLIASLLKSKNQPISSLIDKIHLAGVSMGGHGVWFANILDAINGHQFFDKSLYFCPLIDFYKTMQNHGDNNLYRFLSKYWTWKRLQPLRQKFNVHWRDFFQKENSWLSPWKSKYHQPLVGWPNILFDNEIIKNLNTKIQNNYLTFEELNTWEYWLNKNLNQDISVNPSLVLYTETDPVVPPLVNILNPDHKLDHATALALPKGFHCSIPVNYNEAFMSTFVNEFLMSSTEDKKEHLPHWTQKIKLASTFSGLPNPIFQISDITSVSEKNITLDISEKTGIIVQHLKIEIPRSEIDFDWSNEEYNNSLKRTLLRWLNSHLHLQVINPENELTVSL